jgi:hypothetical protein
MQHSQIAFFFFLVERHPRGFRGMAAEINLGIVHPCAAAGYPAGGLQPTNRLLPCPAGANNTGGVSTGALSMTLHTLERGRLDALDSHRKVLRGRLGGQGWQEFRKIVRPERINTLPFQCRQSGTTARSSDAAVVEYTRDIIAR